MHASKYIKQGMRLWPLLHALRNSCSAMYAPTRHESHSALELVFWSSSVFQLSHHFPKPGSSGAVCLYDQHLQTSEKHLHDCTVITDAILAHPLQFIAAWHLPERCSTASRFGAGFDLDCRLELGRAGWSNATAVKAVKPLQCRSTRMGYG